MVFGKVKRWLGIEGVKMKVVIDEELDRSSGVVTGVIEFSSMNDQTVNFVKLTLIEKFQRGRRKGKMVDDYELGSIELEQEIEVPADEVVQVPFEMPFDELESEMDTWGDSNPLQGGLAKAAKFLRGVKSTYRVEGEARVNGTALGPVDTVEVLFT